MQYFVKHSVVYPHLISVGIRVEVWKKLRVVVILFALPNPRWLIECWTGGMNKVKSWGCWLQTIHFKFISVVLIGVLRRRREKGHVTRHELKGARGKGHVARDAMLWLRWMLLWNCDGQVWVNNSYTDLNSEKWSCLPGDISPISSALVLWLPVVTEHCTVIDVRVPSSNILSSSCGSCGHHGW